MILFYNPLSTTPGKQPLPLSLMSLAAVVEGNEPWQLVDGNLVPDPAPAIIAAAREARLASPVLAVTVMPGPQLTQAVSVCRRVRAELPELPIVWGGYFPTQHSETVLESPYVDFVIRSQGEMALLELLLVLRSGGSFANVGSLSWKDDVGGIVHNSLRPLKSLNDLPELPYHRVAMANYIRGDYLGSRTVAHNSSFGCPFACNFCAVVSMSNRNWIAQSPARVERALRGLARAYDIDAVQMHDMDFFVSEERTAEIADRIADLGIGWWGLGRVDTLMHYSDATWRKMERSGLKMVFSGVESGSDEMLERMNKGGKASAHLAIDLARRMREHAIVPEFSFVLGSPPDPLEDTQRTFELIRKIKRVNPATEIVLYMYTPVALEGTLYLEARQQGFAFPETLEEWASDRWRELSMRRGDRLPWVPPQVRRRVRNFERVLNAFYPTITDDRLTRYRRAVLRAISSWRYLFQIYRAPYELRVLHRLWRYQRPETTGF
ncbi:MAG TPA: radical SAM protein [Vicinamibacteria bacterium]|nr:radical SAM protein [Vicinamibacteria bacterium]